MIFGWGIFGVHYAIVGVDWNACMASAVCDQLSLVTGSRLE
jgi:hypothetical protein